MLVASPGAPPTQSQIVFSPGRGANGGMSKASETQTGEGPKVVRRSPLTPRQRLCPRCLSPLSRGSKLGGWLIPQDYFCPKCGYKGTVFLESSEEKSAKA